MSLFQSLQPHVEKIQFLGVNEQENMLKYSLKRQDVLVLTDRYYQNFKIFSKTIHLPFLFVNIV